MAVFVSGLRKTAPSAPIVLFARSAIAISNCEGQNELRFSLFDFVAEGWISRKLANRCNEIHDLNHVVINTGAAPKPTSKFLLPETEQMKFFRRLEDSN